MIPYIMVEPEKWSEMVKAMEENACLKAENEELHKDYEALADEHTKLIDKNKTLKAEVERLEKDVWRMKVFKGMDEDSIQTLKAAIKTVPEWAKVLEAIENNARLEAENNELKAEVERLRKAGDAMADQIYNEGKTQGICYASNIEAWNAAKEGKPSV